MRVIGYIDNPAVKITVFKTDSRLLIKFENAHFEQTYKLRIGENINHLQDAERIVDEDFLKEVYANFNTMGKALLGTFKRNVHTNE